MKMLTLIHATPVAMEPVHRALKPVPDTRWTDVLDEDLLGEAQRQGGVTADCRDRMRGHIAEATRSGSDAVLITCNAYSSEMAQFRAEFPDTVLLAVDEPMVEAAVASADRIGVLATVATGLRQQRDLIQHVARRQGHDVEVVDVLREEAYDALRAGDPDRHDEILLTALAEFTDVDVILLAQASIARIADILPDSLEIPVLSSPPLAVDRLRDLLLL
jgi:Asp/Glu/hydantoin racemase